LDTGNFTDGWSSIQKVLRHAQHVHAKFWQVAGDGSDEKVDYERIIPALRQARYDGWISYEYEAPEPEETGVPAPWPISSAWSDRRLPPRRAGHLSP